MEIQSPRHKLKMTMQTQRKQTILAGFFFLAKAPRLSPLGKIKRIAKGRTQSYLSVYTFWDLLSWGPDLAFQVLLSRDYGGARPWTRSPSKVTLCCQTSTSTPRTTDTSWCGWTAWGNPVRPWVHVEGPSTLQTPFCSLLSHTPLFGEKIGEIGLFSC